MHAYVCDILYNTFNFRFRDARRFAAAAVRIDTGEFRERERITSVLRASFARATNGSAAFQAFISPPPHEFLNNDGLEP